MAEEDVSASGAVFGAAFASASAAGDAPDVGALLAALRASCDAPTRSIDPVRLRFLESLARRAQAHDGEARRLLDDRLRRLLQDGRADRDTAPRIEPDAAVPRRGPLSELVSHIALQAPPAAARAPVASAASTASAPPAFPGKASGGELNALQYFRRTWSKLSANQRLAQSLSTMPENAGPLNSHHLVHRSLKLMRDVSPEYLERFVSYVDALLWLEHANGGAGREAPGPARPGANAKPGRSRPGL